MHSLHDRLKSIAMFINFSSKSFACVAHREHGNRIMHEFLLGQENIIRDLPRPKPTEYE